MKKMFALILLIALSVVVKTFGQIVDTNIILSNNPARISVAIKTTEKLDTVFSVLEKNTYVVNKKVRCDTVLSFLLDLKSEIILRDSNNNPKIILSFLFQKYGSVKAKEDSLVPRWTHFFGVDTYVTRNLVIKKDSVVCSQSTYQRSANPNSTFFSVFIFSFLGFLFLWFKRGSPSKLETIKIMNKIIWIVSILIFWIVFGFLRVINYPLILGGISFFDSLFLSSLVVVPLFLTLFIKSREEKKIEEFEEESEKC